jgi:hypothetical protein
MWLLHVVVNNFVNGLFQGRSAHNFFKKIGNLFVPPASGSRHKFCKKNIKTPLFADGLAERPSAKKISKTIKLTPR